MKTCDYDCENCTKAVCDNEDYDISLTVEEYNQARERDKEALELQRNVPEDEMQAKYIHNRINKEEYTRERNRRYERARYERDRERILLRKKAQYQRHREEKLQYQRQYYEANRAERILKSRKHYEEHKEEINRKRREQYALEHPKEP